MPTFARLSCLNALAALLLLAPGAWADVRVHDLNGVELPIMALLPEGCSINWKKGDDGKPKVVWGNDDQKFDALGDEADPEAKFAAGTREAGRGPTGD